MIGPEIESHADAGFRPRNLSSRRYEELTNVGLPLVGDEIIASEFVDGRVRESNSDEVARGSLAAAPWWLWWNILSFDAPMVAVAWALVFAQSAGVALAAAETTALGLVVWLIYTVDRLLDGQSGLMSISHGGFAWREEGGAFGPPLRQRHVFHHVHANAIAWTAAGVAAFTAILVLTRIGEQVLKLALPVGSTLVLYMAWVHLDRRRVLARLPKEVAVGTLFAAGVALPVWVRIGARRWEFSLLALLFAAACTLNCVAIEKWERARGRSRDSETGAAAGGESVTPILGSGKFAIALAVCATLITPVVRLRGEFSAIGAAVAVSALLILVLDLMRERISADGLRVLVDVALLAPALVVLAVR